MIDRLAACLVAARMANKKNARKYAVRIVLADPALFGISDIPALEGEQVHVHHDANADTADRVIARTLAEA